MPVLVASLAPARASAWADATVRSASARVRIDERAHAHVAIDATLRIDGGWLEALELDGLDEGLVLDPLDPVTMAPAPAADADGIAAPGAPLEPRVTLRDDGVVVLAFARRHAPRRGDYVVHLAYDADLSAHTRAEDDGVHVPWTFPAWRHGLDSVQVELTLPSGAGPVLDADDEIESSLREQDGLAVWTLTRAHLARTREWPIEILAPAGTIAAVAPAPEPSAEAAPVPGAAEAPRPPWQGGLALALASLLVALRVLRRATLDARERVASRPLVALPAKLRALLIVGLGAASMGAALVGGSWILLLSLAASTSVLAWSRGAPRPLEPRLGSFRHATPSLRRAARRAARWHHLGVDAWLDASSAPGLALLGGLALGVTQVPHAALGPCLLALAVVGGALLDAPRIARPEPPLVALMSLLAFARRVRTAHDASPLALMPVLHLDVAGVAQEARLRVLSPLGDGALRTDVVVAQRGVFGVRHALLIVVARGSELDRALEGDESIQIVAVGPERIARAVPVTPTTIDVALARIAGRIVRRAEASAAPALTSAA